MGKSRDEAIDIAKGIAIFLVVWGHVIQYTITPTGTDFFLNPVFEVIYSFHMPLFMFISGYLSTYSLKRRSLKENLDNKIKGILIPYVLWTIIISLTTAFLEIINKEAINIVGFLKLLISNFIAYPNIWFLYALFIFYCVLFLTILLEKKIGKIAFVILPVLIFVIPIKTYFGVYYIQFFYLFFLAGYLVNQYRITYSTRELSKNKSFIVFVVLLLLYVVLILQWDRTDYIYINLMQINQENNIILEALKIVYRYIIAFVGIALVIFVSNFIKKLKISNILKTMGTYTLDIYLIQNIIVSLLYRQLVETYDFAINLNGLFFIIYCLMVTTFSILLCIWISKGFIQRSGLLNSVLLGGNSKVKISQ